MTCCVNMAMPIHFLIKFYSIYKCTKEVKETAYFTLVRAVLEYAAILWEQYLINNIEKIQRRAARHWVTGDYHLTGSVSEMLFALKWPSLECRLHSRLIMFYNLVNNLLSLTCHNIAILLSPFITLAIITHFTI